MSEGPYYFQGEQDESYFDNFLHDKHVIVSGGLFLVCLLCVCSLLLQYHISHVWKLIHIPEAVATMTIGMSISAILRFTGVYELLNESTNNNMGILGVEFNESIFFFVLLPPILFNSGFHLDRNLFFSQFGGVMGLALIGTLLSSIVVGTGLYFLGISGYTSVSLTLQEAIAFAALISSTDPVSTLSAFSQLKADPTLFYLVFGESILNDSICVTLFRGAIKLVGKDLQVYDVLMASLECALSFVFSCALGYLSGFFSPAMPTIYLL